ncbi:MAG: hypothetical protein D6722_25590, partial [Bacteroidetes bacterium]
LDLVSYSCGQCQSIFAQPPEVPATSCPFCEGEELGRGQQHQQLAEPFSLIPFAISRSSALSRLGRLWLLPPAIRAVLKPERMRAMYIPFFLFDTLTRSTWRAMVGFSFIENTRNGPRDSKAWEPSTGYYEHFYENLEVPASVGADPVNLADILPFDWSKVVPYDPRYLRDTPVECYQESEIGTFRLADQLLDMEIHDAIMGRLPGHDVKKMLVNSEKHSIAFRHVLVPVWVASFVFRGELYQFLINGQSGKITGDRPLSNRRLFILLGGLFLLIVLLVVLLSL